jgi:2-iminoacetate synthase
MNRGSFVDLFNSIESPAVYEMIYGSSGMDVERALATRRRTLRDFAALISPAARPYLERMAAMSQTITRRRFGKTISMYAPLYLSNECQNICTYCGFSFTNKIPRLTLSSGEIETEARAVKELGFDHVLLVTGEASQRVGMPYFRDALKVIRPLFSTISMEVQPLEENEYLELASLGVYAVLVYQETYNRERYKSYHPKGRKSVFDYRLQTPDRLGRAGIHKIGLGVLFGLHDWRLDSWHLAQHLSYLEQRYWKTKYSISFPRLRPAAGVEPSREMINDAELVQLICAYRIFNEDVELSLSTRESSSFRDKLIPLGITSMSAGSKTDPGGYALRRGSLEQFSTDDKRSPIEVARAIQAAGYDPVWKDWDPSFGLSDRAYSVSA